MAATRKAGSVGSLANSLGGGGSEGSGVGAEGGSASAAGTEGFKLTAAGAETGGVGEDGRATGFEPRVPPDKDALAGKVCSSSKAPRSAWASAGAASPMGVVGSGVGASGSGASSANGSSSVERGSASRPGAEAAASDSSLALAAIRDGGLMSTVVRWAVRGSPSESGAADSGAAGSDAGGGFEGAAEGVIRSASERVVAGGRDARGTSGSERSGAASTVAGGRPMALRRGTSSTGTRSGRGRLVIYSSVWRVTQIPKAQTRSTSLAARGIPASLRAPRGGQSGRRRRKVRVRSWKRRLGTRQRAGVVRYFGLGRMLSDEAD